MFTRHRVVIAAVLGFCLFLESARPAETLPDQLSNEAFWKLVTDFSEPGGTFLSPNFVSNERSFQHALSDLAQGRQPASAYLGVGPEQNFTYIIALKPQIAFIVDIRRQNMIQHLMYKALFELSADRVEFLSRLFSQPRPPDVGKESSVTELFIPFRGIPGDPMIFAENLQAIKDRLIKDHGFKLTSEDLTSLEYVFRAFYGAGINLTYNGVRLGNLAGIMPTYEEIMSETDKQGQYRSYLATEANFQFVKQMEKNNLLVPLVGDFAGPGAIQSVGQYLREHNATVTAFYTSNVEQYLFQGPDAWKKFYENVSLLPVDTRSVFVRGLIRTIGGEYSPSPAMQTTSRYETGLYPIADFVVAFKAGRIQSYYDVVGPVK